MAALWRRVFTVELVLQLAVAAAVVPSSLSAWGVATLPFALVWVLDLQAAAPAAVAEGEQAGGGRWAGTRHVMGSLHCLCCAALLLVAAAVPWTRLVPAQPRPSCC